MWERAVLCSVHGLLGTRLRRPLALAECCCLPRPLCRPSSGAPGLQDSKHGCMLHILHAHSEKLSSPTIRCGSSKCLSTGVPMGRRRLISSIRSCGGTLLEGLKLRIMSGKQISSCLSAVPAATEH